MLINYLSIYLIFIFVIALVVGALVLRLKFPAPQIVIPAIMVIIVSPLLFGFFYIFYFTSLPEVTVPELKGLSLEEAQDKLREVRLRARHAGDVFETSVAQGHVVSQRPEAGRKVKVGRVVSLLTSSEKRKTTVPNLLGRSVEQARAVLSAKGLELGDLSLDLAPEMDAGIVLAQIPLPGEETDMGLAVDVTVSTTQEVFLPAEVSSEGQTQTQTQTQEGSQ